MNKRIAAFDLIRIIACICVITVHFNATIISHSQNPVIPSQYINGKAYLGDIGVCLFFILSGATQVLTFKENNNLKYYWKRLMSLYPMFWVAYLTATILDLILYKWFSTRNPFLILYSIFGIDGYYCAKGYLAFDYYKLGEWFLGCIVLLYCIFPLIHKCLKKPLMALLSLGVFILIYWIIVEKNITQTYTISKVSFFLRIPEFFFGMFIAKYKLWEKSKIYFFTICSALLFSVSYYCMNSIVPLTFTISFCVLLFSLFLMVFQDYSYRNNGNQLMIISGLTYPVFLVHHWMIDRFCTFIDISHLNKSGIIFLYLAYIIFSFFAAFVLKKFTDTFVTGNIMKLSEKKQRVITVSMMTCIILLCILAVTMHLIEFI